MDFSLLSEHSVLSRVVRACCLPFCIQEEWHARPDTKAKRQCFQKCSRICMITFTGMSYFTVSLGLIVETDSPCPNKGLKSVSLTGWWGESRHNSKYLQVVESTLQWLKCYTNKWCLKRLSVLQLCLDFVSDGLTGWINLLLFWRNGCSTGNDNLTSGSSRWSCEQTYSSFIFATRQDADMQCVQRTDSKIQMPCLQNKIVSNFK